MLIKLIYIFNTTPVKNPYTFTEIFKNSQWKSLQHFYRNRQKFSKIHMEPQKTSNSQRDPEQKEKWWRGHHFIFQAILYSYNNKNSMLQALTQACRSTRKNRRPKYEFKLLHTSCIWQRCQRHTWEKW